MLKLENIHDVTFVKNGQEAYDTVKTSLDKAVLYDLIFMDIQVRNGNIWSKSCANLSDAECGRSTKHTAYSPDRIFRTNYCPDCIFKRKQCQGLHGGWHGHVPQVGSLCVL